MKYLILFLFSLTLIACGSEEASNEDDNSESKTNHESEEVTAMEETDSSEEVVAPEEESEVEENCEVDLDAYILDPDTEGKTNIRKTPGGEVVLQVGGDFMDEYFLHIVDQQDGWFKVEDKIGGIEADYEIPGGIGWIHGSVCQVDSRNYASQELHLYSEPSEDASKVVSFTRESQGFHLLKICGEWVKVIGTVDGKEVQGWIQKEWLCGNPLTNCS